MSGHDECRVFEPDSGVRTSAPRTVRVPAMKRELEVRSSRSRIDASIIGTRVPLPHTITVPAQYSLSGIRPHLTQRVRVRANGS